MLSFPYPIYLKRKIYIFIYILSTFPGFYLFPSVPSILRSLRSFYFFSFVLFFLSSLSHLFNYKMLSTMLPQTQPPFYKRSVMDLSSMMSPDYAPPTPPSTSADGLWRESPDSGCGSYFNIALSPSSTTSSSETYALYPKPPLSPPEHRKRKCSLPSISSLLEGAENPSSKSTSLFFLFFKKKKENFNNWEFN